MASFQKHGAGLRLATVAVFAGTSVVAWLLISHFIHPFSNRPLSPIAIAVPTLVSSGAVYVAIDQGMFEKHGLQVTVQPFAMGKLAMAAVKRGDANLSVMADTAFMFSVMRGEGFAVLGTLFASRRNMAVVARSESDIHTAKDLVGKTVATVASTNNQFFLDALLLANGVERSSVNIVFLKPDELVPQLQSGKIDAATLWHPNFFQAQQALGGHATRIYGDDVFVFRFLLGGKADYLNAHPIEMQEILASIDDANRFIREQPIKAKSIIGKAMGLNESILASDFNPTDYTLSLDQTLLLALDDQTRWAMKRGLAPEKALPNYLDLMQAAPLEAVRIDAVRLIQ
jgi:ABC-type nitrate/sulfonate/bicarbonate transport system substrate-binding protein